MARACLRNSVCYFVLDEREEPGGQQYSLWTGPIASLAALRDQDKARWRRRTYFCGRGAGLRSAWSVLPLLRPVGQSLPLLLLPSPNEVAATRSTVVTPMEIAASATAARSSGRPPMAPRGRRRERRWSRVAQKKRQGPRSMRCACERERERGRERGRRSRGRSAAKSPDTGSAGLMRRRREKRRRRTKRAMSEATGDAAPTLSLRSTERGEGGEKRARARAG